MPTSEQRGHFGLARSGGGMTLSSAMRRAAATADRTSARAASVHGTTTRAFDAA
jgi:hypothetical protein